MAHSTLADANRSRDWRIYADLAQSLITRARRLYADETLGVELEQTVYALDSTTIDLCLSLFPWARFRRAKAAIKLHTLLDLRGPIPTMIAISDGKQAAMCACWTSLIPGSGSLLCDGSRLRIGFPEAPSIRDGGRILCHPGSAQNQPASSTAWHRARWMPRPESEAIKSSGCASRYVGTTKKTNTIIRRGKIWSHNAG